MIGAFLFLALQWGAGGCETASWQLASQGIRYGVQSRINVNYPDDCELWIGDGERIQGNQIVTPWLQPGRYKYTLKLRRAGQVVAEKEVSFQAGESVDITMSIEPRPPVKPNTPNVGDLPPTGVDVASIDFPDGTTITTNSGREITRTQAKEMIGKDKVPDHAKCLRLTVVGNESELADTKTKLAGVLNPGEPLVLGFFKPDAWQLRDLKTNQPLGFPSGSPVTAYLQMPSGEVVCKSTGADSIVAMVTALRQKNPTFDPAKVSDFAGGTIMGSGNEIKAGVIGGIATLLLLAFLRKN